MKSLANKAFLIGPAEINRVLLKRIIRPWGFRRRMNCWHCTVRVVSTDTILSVIHQKVIDVPSRAENKRKEARSGEEERGRRDTFISSAMKDKRHNIKTFGRPSFTVSLLWAWVWLCVSVCVCLCVCVWEGEKRVIWFSVPCLIAKDGDDQAI